MQRLLTLSAIAILTLSSFVALPAQAAGGPGTPWSSSSTTSNLPTDCSSSFNDGCYHMRGGLNALDSPKIDVLLVVPASPWAERDLRAMHQVIDMYDAGIDFIAENEGWSWLADGVEFHVTPMVCDFTTNGCGEFSTYPGYDPEIVVIRANPFFVPVGLGAIVGIGIDPFTDQITCYPPGVQNPFDIEEWEMLPGFDSHHDGRSGTYAEDCDGNGGNVCFAVNGGLEVAPDVDLFGINVYDLVAHEVGHCLRLGHVGDAGTEFTTAAAPLDDIMSYAWDDTRKCVSSLDVETFAVAMSPYLDVNGDGVVNGADRFHYNDKNGNNGADGDPFQVQHPDDHYYASSTGKAADCPQPDLGIEPLGAPVDFSPDARPNVPFIEIHSPTQGQVDSTVAVSGIVGYGSSGEGDDTDGDGLPDSEDECIEEPGPASTNGCPRTDVEVVTDPSGDASTSKATHDIVRGGASSNADRVAFSVTVDDLDPAEPQFFVRVDFQNELDPEQLTYGVVASSTGAGVGVYQAIGVPGVISGGPRVSEDVQVEIFADTIYFDAPRSAIGAYPDGSGLLNVSFGITSATTNSPVTYDATDEGDYSLGASAASAAGQPSTRPIDPLGALPAGIAIGMPAVPEAPQVPTVSEDREPTGVLGSLRRSLSQGVQHVLEALNVRSPPAPESSQPATPAEAGRPTTRQLTVPEILAPRSITRTETFVHEDEFGDNTFFPEDSTPGGDAAFVRGEAGLEARHFFELELTTTSDVAFRLAWTDASGLSDLDLYVTGDGVDSEGEGAQPNPIVTVDETVVLEDVATGTLLIEVQPYLVLADPLEGTVYTLVADITETGSGDDDGDGVSNDLDACPGTPPGTDVDATGCPVDDLGGEQVKLFIGDTEVGAIGIDSTTSLEWSLPNVDLSEYAGQEISLAAAWFNAAGTEIARSESVALVVGTARELCEPEGQSVEDGGEAGACMGNSRPEILVDTFALSTDLLIEDGSDQAVTLSVTLYDENSAAHLDLDSLGLVATPADGITVLGLTTSEGADDNHIVVHLPFTVASGAEPGLYDLTLSVADQGVPGHPETAMGTSATFSDAFQLLPAADLVVTIPDDVLSFGDTSAGAEDVETTNHFVVRNALHAQHDIRFAIGDLANLDTGADCNDVQEKDCIRLVDNLVALVDSTAEDDGSFTFTDAVEIAYTGEGSSLGLLDDGQSMGVKLRILEVGNVFPGGYGSTFSVTEL